jgi:hypothetical protein
LRRIEFNGDARKSGTAPCREHRFASRADELPGQGPRCDCCRMKGWDSWTGTGAWLTAQYSNHSKTGSCCLPSPPPSALSCCRLPPLRTRTLRASCGQTERTRRRPTRRIFGQTARQTHRETSGAKRPRSDPITRTGRPVRPMQPAPWWAGTTPRIEEAPARRSMTSRAPGTHRERLHQAVPPMLLPRRHHQAPRRHPRGLRRLPRAKTS